MKLLAAIDFSPVTDRIFDYLKKLDNKQDMKVWLIHVVQPDPDFVGYDAGPQTERDFVAKKYSDKHKMIQNQAAELRASGLNVTPLLLQGATVETILEEAADINADMIIAGSHGHGMMYDIFVGSVSRELLNKATIPVLIIPGEKD